MSTITFTAVEADEVVMHLEDALASARDRMRWYRAEGGSEAGHGLAMSCCQDRIERVGSALAKFDAARRGCASARTFEEPAPEPEDACRRRASRDRMTDALREIARDREARSGDGGPPAGDAY